MIGVAISCYVGHLHLLYDLLDSIEKQTIMPDMVVVSCSSTPKMLEPIVNRSLKKYTMNYKILYTDEHKNASQNRNIAINELMEMDYITFMDADDMMHPQRIEFILKTFEETNADIILHHYSFTPIFELNELKYRLNGMQIHESGCIEHKEYVYRNSEWIHHSQSSVKREVVDKVRFREESMYNRREDCFFCADVFRLNGNHVYIKNALSYYRPSLTDF